MKPNQPKSSDFPKNWGKIEEPQQQEWETMTDSVSGKKSQALFISDDCECHYIEPYGFVPEADCKNHDTVPFCNFIRSLLKSQQSPHKAELKRVREEWGKSLRLKIERQLKDLIK